jgi:3-deoxy-D-arabino-heptulosonate 7-phosphate (DAHP) synthase
MARQLDALATTPGSILCLSWVGGFRRRAAYSLDTYARHSLQDASVLPAAVDQGPTGTSRASELFPAAGAAIEGAFEGTMEGHTGASKAKQTEERRNANNGLLLSPRATIYRFQ